MERWEKSNTHDDSVVPRIRRDRELVHDVHPAGAHGAAGAHSHFHAEAEARAAPLTAVSSLHAAHFVIVQGTNGEGRTETRTDFSL